MKLKVLDLFSGIGGFSIGLERTGGFETVAFCEIEPFPRKVLTKHWPEIIIYEDVRKLTADRLAADGIAVDVICGGFPCQDISTAGKGAGLAGERSGLWSEIARLVDELRPSFVIVENVSALLGRGLGTVLGDLAALRYDAEWHCIPASHVGAPHRRDRIWIVAYPNDKGLQGCERSGEASEEGPPCRHSAECCGNVADAKRGAVETFGKGRILAEPSLQRAADRFANGGLSANWQWRVEPELGRVANGIPNRSHRLKGLGNAVVPQIPELIGYAILDSHNA